MPTQSTQQLERYFNEGERQISQECNLFVDRLSIATDGINAVYTLPDYVRNIQRVTYLGTKVWPLPQRNLREVFQNANQFGRPFWFVYNNIGQNKIQFFPKPNQAIPQVSSPWDTGIATGVIVEFFRVTDNVNFTLPAYIRNFLLKRFVGSQAFMVEGPGQNLKMAQYLGQQWEQWKELFINLVNELHSRPRKILVDEIVSSNYFPAAPVLPIAQFGISVEEGY